MFPPAWNSTLGILGDTPLCSQATRSATCSFVLSSKSISILQSTSGSSISSVVGSLPRYWPRTSDRGGCSKRNTPLPRLCCQAPDSICGRVRGGTFKVPSCYRGDRAFTNTTMRRVRFCFLTRVQLGEPRKIRGESSHPRFDFLWAFSSRRSTTSPERREQMYFQSCTLLCFSQRKLAAAEIMTAEIND